MNEHVLGDVLSSIVRDAAREAAKQAVTDYAARSADTASRWLNVKSAAEYLDITEHALRSLVKRNDIPVHRAPNGRLLFHAVELDEWVRGEVEFNGGHQAGLSA